MIFERLGLLVFSAREAILVEASNPPNMAGCNNSTRCSGRIFQTISMVRNWYFPHKDTLLRVVWGMLLYVNVPSFWFVQDGPYAQKIIRCDREHWLARTGEFAPAVLFNLPNRNILYMKLLSILLSKKNGMSRYVNHRNNSQIEIPMGPNLLKRCQLCEVSFEANVGPIFITGMFSAPFRSPLWMVHHYKARSSPSDLKCVRPRWFLCQQRQLAEQHDFFLVEDVVSRTRGRLYDPRFWLNHPSERYDMIVKLDHFPNFRGENFFELPPPTIIFLQYPSCILVWPFGLFCKTIYRLSMCFPYMGFLTHLKPIGYLDLLKVLGKIWTHIPQMVV